MRNWNTLGLMAVLAALPGAVLAAQLTVSLEKPAGSVHPLRSNTLEAVLIGNQIYQPLVGIGPSGDIEPVLVESWSYDPARRRFDFKLKDGLHFSNGESLTSANVVDTIKWIIAENRVQNFSRIKGAPAYASRRSGEVAGLKRRGRLGFTIELDVAYPRFLADLADPYASIFLEDPQSPLPLGTGPYMFKQVSSEGKRVVIERSPRAVPSPAAFDAIAFTSDRDEAADLYLGDPKDRSNSRLRKVEYLDTEVVFLAFNAANPALADIRGRRYLGAVLTPAMLDASLGAIPYKVGGYIPFGTAGYSPNLVFPDLPDRSARPKAVTVFNYMDRLTPLARRYCAALEEAGVACRLKLAGVDEMYKAKADGSLQVAFVRQKSTTYSVEYLLSCFTSRSACNIFTTANANSRISAELDELFERMLRTPASEKKTLLRLYKDMDAAVLAEALVKPIRYGVNKAVWYDRRLFVPALDTLGPFGMKLENVKIAD